jgi:hypothetical protein
MIHGAATMAMTIQALEKTLKRAFPELRYSVDHERESISVDIAREAYRSPEGKDGVTVGLELFEKGEYLELQCQWLYDASQSAHRGALSRLLLGVSLRTPLVQFSFDEADGEVRATAEVVLADGSITPLQLKLMLTTLVGVIDAFHPHVVRAMETGEISFPNEETIVRATLADQSGDDVSLAAPLEIGEMLKALLAESRLRGRKMWEDAAPKRSVGRHG